jgi:phosphohistidine swiveling domain-containing protein
MADDKLAELFKTQKSLTEWMDDIKHKDVEALRAEDNEKHQRLGILKRVIGLPFDEPTQFEAVDLANKTPAFKKFLKERGDELCAIRMIPQEPGLAKIRMRGKPIKEAYMWFLEQDIDPTKYRADFLPHEHYQIWSTIFIVNQNGIQGEIIKGGHHQLTQGFHETARPRVFKYDFKEWTIYPRDKAALDHLKILVEHIRVPDPAQQEKLKKELKSTFAHNYLEGYFETIESEEFGLWYKDYSRTLGNLYKDLEVKIPSNSKAVLRGMTGSAGKAEGHVQIIDPSTFEDFIEGSILVCKITTPDYVPLMQKAAAIVTDQGGILSHAAIVARELKKACIVGVGNATEALKTGQRVVVDADAGTVDLI